MTPTPLKWRIVRHIRSRGVPYGFFAVAVALVVRTFGDYGIIWDEPFQRTYGDLILEYWRAGFTGQGPMNYMDLYLYGGAFDSLAQALCRVSPLGVYETRHLFNALVGLLGAVACFRIGRLVGGTAAGMSAAVLLLLYPRYFGHMFVNPKDIPFAVGYAWSLYYLLLALREAPDIRIGVLVRLGVVVGLTMGVRVGGLLLLAYFGALLGVAFVYRGRQGFAEGLGARRLAVLLGHSARSLVVSSTIAYATMLLFWPWALENPLRRPLEALERVSKFPRAIRMVFEGRWIWANQLPPDYVPKWFSITIPELHMVLFGVATLGLIAVPLRYRHRVFSFEYAATWFLLFATAFPIAYVMIQQAVLYDEVRHLLFVVPPAVTLCGLGLGKVLRAAVGWPLLLRRVVAVAAALVLFYHVTTLALLHPYQMVYFNHLSGGLRAAYGRFETDYWGASYREAVLTLRELVEREKRELPGRIYRVAISDLCAHPESATYYFPPYFQRVDDRSAADYFIATTRQNCDHLYEGPVVGVVQRFGVPLSLIKDTRGVRAVH